MAAYVLAGHQQQYLKCPAGTTVGNRLPVVLQHSSSYCTVDGQTSASVRASVLTVPVIVAQHLSLSNRRVVLPPGRTPISSLYVDNHTTAHYCQLAGSYALQAHHTALTHCNCLVTVWSASCRARRQGGQECGA